MSRTKKIYYRRNRTQRKRIVNMNPMSCSPIVKNKRIHNSTCLTPEVLTSIKIAYNKKNPTEQIKETDPTKIWWALKNRLDCQKEECWLDSLFEPSMKEKIKRFIFAPKHPPEWKSNPNEWLTNFDIEKVMKQYEVSNPEFKFIGPTTIDFDSRPEDWGGKCVLEDLCRFDLARFIRAKRTKIGIVFNLDKHDQSGSHWVSLFIDIENKFIFFFDSADNPIPKEIYQENISNKPNDKNPLVNRILEQGLKEDIHFTFYNNRGRQHQKSNTECGMYSLFFIITMLTGENPFTKGRMPISSRIRLFLKKNIPDKLMASCRKIFYNE